MSRAKCFIDSMWN